MTGPKFFLFITILFLAPPNWAINIPTGLNQSDRQEVVRILGQSTSSKLLTNPYPLGGYSGFEVGLSLEIVNTTDLSRLGDTVTPQADFKYPRITIGKGLYNDLDFFAHFIPYNEKTDTSEFGGLARWCFYQAKFLPINISFVGHGSTINIGDSFISTSMGTEIVVGINVKRLALYFGGGSVTSEGKFMSGIGDDSIVDPGDLSGNEADKNIATEKVSSTHTFVGIDVRFYDLFVALQIDRYRDPVYSTKLGLRF